MAPVRDFTLDHWMQINQNLAKVSLVDSCVSPLTLSELGAFGDEDDDDHHQNNLGPPLDPGLPLHYGPTRGSRLLRERVAALFSRVHPAVPAVTWEDILVTTGTILANFLILDTLCGPGDHVICQYPTYQQLYEVPRRAGADVSLWRLKESHSWIPDVDELDGLVRENTKLLIINNPINPTGAVIPRSTLAKIIAFAAKHDITVLADEVFSPMFHATTPSDPEYPPSVLCMGYGKVISTGSVSKCFALPGIRTGWVATNIPGLVDTLVRARDYTTIAVSRLDDQVAAYALESRVREKILKRSLDICKTNLDLLDEFVRSNEDVCSWVKPRGAGTSFVKFTGRDGSPVDDKAFCEDVLREKGLMVIPGGHCFGTELQGEFRGFVRIGFVCATEHMATGLDLLQRYLDENIRGTR